MSSFTPTTGGAGTNISIKGTHLTGITSVWFGDTLAHSFTIVDDTLINAIVGTGTTGWVLVDGPQGMDSLAGFTFTGSAPAPSPVVSSFSPASAATGTTVSIHGTHFTGTYLVVFGNIAAQSFSIVSDSLISAVVGTGNTGSVIVEATSGTGSRAGFTYIPPTPAPVITSFSPVSGTTGTTITVHGTRFTGTTSVYFGDTLAHSFTVISDSLMTAIVGAGATGSVLLDGGAGRIDSLAGFTFTTSAPAPAPAVSSFSPASAATGTTVTIHGTHFTGAYGVIFGNNAAQSFSIVSDTLIRAVVGTGATGSVIVEGPGGTGSRSGFVYIPPPPTAPTPVITSFSPDSAATGATVTIHGANFIGTTSVWFGDTLARSFAIVSDSLITAIVGAGATGSVLLEGSGAGSIDSLAGFRFIATARPAVIPSTLTVYPNPAVGSSMTVAVPVTTLPSQFELADLAGRILRTFPVSPNVPQAKIDLRGVLKGVYKLIWSDGPHSSYQTILVMQ